MEERLAELEGRLARFEGRGRTRRGAVLAAGAAALALACATPGRSQVARKRPAPMTTATRLQQAETRLQQVETRLQQSDTRLKSAEARLKTAEAALGALQAKAAESASGTRVRAPFVVESSSGKSLLEVQDGDGGPSMRMLNADGKDVLWLSTDRNGAQIATLDDAGDYAAALSAGRTGGRLTLMQKGRGSATVSVDDAGGRLLLTDKDGQRVNGGR